MTVEAKKRKNQKKKLRLKEKKAAERAALASIAGANDVETAGICSDPLIVDRVAAEEVLPPLKLNGKTDELISQTEWIRQGSPQISTEPMGQALERSLDVDDLGPQDGQDQEESVNFYNDEQKSEEQLYKFSGRFQTETIPREVYESTQEDTASSNTPDETHILEVAPEGSIVNIEQAMQAARRVSETSSTQVQQRLAENSNNLKNSEKGQRKVRELRTNWISTEQLREPLGSIEQENQGSTASENAQSIAMSVEQKALQEQTQEKDSENIDGQAGTESALEQGSQQSLGHISQHAGVQMRKSQTEQQLGTPEQEIRIDETNDERHKASGEVLQSSRVMGICNTVLEDLEKEFTSDQTPEDSLEDLKAATQAQEPPPHEHMTPLNNEDHINPPFAERGQESTPCNTSEPIQEPSNTCATVDASENQKNAQERATPKSEIVEETETQLQRLSDQEPLENPFNDNHQEEEVFSGPEEREDHEETLLATNSLVNKILIPQLEPVEDSEPIASQEKETTAESEKQYKEILLGERLSKGETKIDSLFGKKEKEQHEPMPWEISSQGIQESSGSTIPTTVTEFVGNLAPTISRKSQPEAENKRHFPEPQEKELPFKDENNVSELFGETEEVKQEVLPREAPEPPSFVEPIPASAVVSKHAIGQQSQTVVESIKEAQEPLENLQHFKYDGQVDELFGETEQGEQESMPWEPSEPSQKMSKVEAHTEKIDEQVPKGETKVEQSISQIDSLFNETEHQPMPWEVSHTSQENEEYAAVDNGKIISKDNMELSQEESAGTKKFSFLEDDDDLLDDDDSYLDSDEELEGPEEHIGDVGTAESGSRDENVTRRQSQTQANHTVVASSNSPTKLPGASSRYKPSTVPYVEPSGLQRGSYETGVPPQAIKSNIGPSVIPSQQQGQVGFTAQRQNVLEGQKVIEKINKEKMKSDAFDFPMDFVSKGTARVPAKPVGVPASRITPSPPFDTAQAPPRKSRTNSVNVLPNNPYAAAASASKSKMQAPLPPQGAVLPQNTLPLGSQLPTPQAIPFPASRQPSMRPQNSLDLRTRGFSNMSAGSISAGAVGSVPLTYTPAAPGRATESKYTPVSPMKPPAVYPPLSVVTGAIGSVPPSTGPISGGPLKGVPARGGSYIPQNPMQKLPVSPQFSNAAPNFPLNAAQNLAIPPSYSIPIVNVAPNPTSQGYPLAGTPNNTGGGPPTGARQKQTASRSHARSNSSVYAPNQSEFNSKYAPTVHPQYKNISPPPASVGLQNTLSTINSYMNSTQAGGIVGPGAELLSVPKSVDNEALLQHQFPLFSWSASEKINYGIPIDNGQNAYIMGSSSTVQNFSLVNVDAILLPQYFLKSFPGPLSKNKTKKKDILKWFDDYANEFAKEEHYLNSTIVSLLKLKLNDNVNFKDISRILYNSDELLLYLSQPAMQPRQIPSASKLDANNQMRISAYLQTGGQDEALQLALGMNDFSMALLIGSLMGKEKWSEVVESYLAHEIELGANDSGFVSNLFSLIFQVFIGSSKTAFQEFYVNDTKCKWALDNWKMVVAAVLNNISPVVKPFHPSGLEVPPVVVEFLVEYGVFLSRKGMTLAACILFMIANLPLSSNPIVPEVDIKFEFVGNPESLESLVFSEIYEFCVSDSKAFPVLLPQKLYHAACLQERGFTAAASKYTDYLNGVLRTLPKKEPFTINLTHRLNDLNACIAGTSTGWLGKPKLSSVWGHLDKSFNKLIGGDDDVLIKKSAGKKVFDGFTPVSSRNNSTLDLSQTPFVPYQGHSKKPSLGHSDAGNSIQPIGHSPIRNPVPIEEVYTGPHPDTHSRHSSQMNNAYQGSPKASLYNPSRISSASHAPPKLRRVHTMQPIGGQLPPFMPASTESLNTVPDYREKPSSNGKLQESLNAAFSEGKPTLHYNSTPNLLRRSSAASDTSAVGRENLSMGKRFGDLPHGIVGGHLEETIEETGPVSKSLPKYSGGNASDVHEVLAERPYLAGPSYPQVNESSPVSIVATESTTDDAATNSEAERTVLHNESASLTDASVEPNIPYAVSPAEVIGQGSGETLRQNDEGPNKEYMGSLATAPEDVPLIRANKAEPGIRMRGSQSNSSKESKVNPPFTPKSNPYAADTSIRNTSSSKAAYVPKSLPRGPVHASSAQHTPQMNLNGLGMFVEDSNVLNQGQEENFVASSSSDVKAFTPVLQQPAPELGRANPISRFDPIKEPEEVSADTFEPVIKKTPKIRAFTPLVVQPPETQYDDIVEDESEDEDEVNAKAKREEEEKKAKENAKAKEEEERLEKEKAKQSKKEKEKEKEAQEKSSSGWFGWLKKDSNEKKPIKAKLGNKKRNFHYDDKLKRWVNNNATDEEMEKLSAPPPPPPVVKRVDNSPKTKPRSGSLIAAPKSTAGAVVPKNPITGEPLSSPSLSILSPASSEVPSLSPLANSSGVNLAGRKANGLDDLLNLSGGGVTNTRRKKKPGRGYVNVMENK